MAREPDRMSNFYWLQLVLALSEHDFQLLNYFVWPRITDEGSLSEMRICPILLIESDLKCCMHLGRSLVIFQLLGECHC